MKRRDFLKQTCATAGAAGAMTLLGPRLGLAADKVQGKKLNVLFIAVDDLRPQLGCYGHDFMKSPHIDKLAGRGMLFQRTYCQVPVCGASRASLLTGLRPKGPRFHHWNCRADKDAPDAVTLPQHFKENGYVTLANGKIFHHSSDCHDKSWSEKHWRPPAGWPGYQTDAAKRKGRGCYAGAAYEAADVEDNKYPDGQIAEKTVSDLKRLAKGDKPFFIACGLTKPHLPFLAPKKYWDLYDRAKIKMADNPFAPKGAPKESLHKWKELRGYTGMPKRGRMSKELERTLVHGYYACVSYIDAQVGKIMAELDKQGLRDKTIVILWGDHGWNLGEHGLWCKHANYHTSLHAPMMVAGPGVKPGRKTNALTEFVDIYPSLCELAGIPPANGLEGTSFVPLLEKPGRPWKKAIYSQYYSTTRGGKTVRDDRYVYTEYYWKDHTVAKMMYDHQKDPKENVNIVGQPENAEIVKKMARLLRADWKTVLPDGIQAPG